MRIGKITVALLSLAIAAIAYVFWQMNSPSPGLTRRFVKEMTPVEIYLQHAQGAGTRLRIPAAYMQWSEDRAGGVSDGMVVLVAVYPEMTPVALSQNPDKGEFSIDPLRFDSLIHIRPSLPDGIKRIFAESVNPTTLIRHHDTPGFSLYRAEFAGQTREYLVPIAQGGTSDATDVVFACGPYLDNDVTKRLWGQCDVHAQATDRIIVVYDVPGGALDRWYEVHEKVMTLFRSLVVDCFEGPKLKGGDRPDELYPCQIDGDGTYRQ